MDHNQAYREYINLANAFFENQISEGDLPRAIQRLPILDKSILAQLGDQAEKLALQDPKRSWGIALVADHAAKFQGLGLFTRSMAAWYLGRASNHWAQPKQTEEALVRARQGFLELREMGWVAACDWQYYVLSWTRPDIALAEKTLLRALDELQNNDLIDFVPHCRLALAYVQILLGKYLEAKQNIQASELTFIAQNDSLNQARCWLNEASYLRREGHVEEAIQKLSAALTVFEESNAPIDMAKASFQIALCHLLRTDKLSDAIAQFIKAIGIFDAHHMDLWRASCLSNLGYAYLLTGALDAAHSNLQQAGEIFSHHEVLGALADNLNDNGKLNIQRGDPFASIEQFKQAEKIHNQLGMQLSAAIDIANLGEAYGHAGRYQDALYYLELAAARLTSINNFIRLGSVEKFTASIWAQLGQPVIALKYLNAAAKHHEMADQKALLASVYNHRAVILFSQKEELEAIKYLEKSLQTALEHDLRPQAALARRLLGEALAHSKLGLKYLEQAKSDFLDMGMIMELAITLVAIGKYYTWTSQFSEARKSFEEALQLSEGVFFEVDWRAYEGLANLAEIYGDHPREIQMYQLGTEALVKIRRNFWQPALAGSYLQISSSFFDKAINRAIKVNISDHVLEFMENNKATTLVYQLLNNQAGVINEKSQELSKLKAEINWLQDQLRSTAAGGNLLKFAVQSRKHRTQLIEKAKEYDAMMALLERMDFTDKSISMFAENFDLDVFRKLANEVLSGNWVAINYHMAEDRINMVMVTPDDFKIYSVVLSERSNMALEALNRISQNNPISPSDLRILGDLLIPDSAAGYLTPETYLLISPHKELHRIPWAALYPSFTSEPLVHTCIPSIVPSLHSLSLLWKRNLDGLLQGNNNGLLIGISDFQGSKPELPYVRSEMTSIASRMGAKGKLLIENAATWANISKLRDDKTGLSQFDWLHIASHFFTDIHTGRLSGISLHDRDVWLDQIRDLAPLPELVTFSACSSIYSYVYGGDEHVGLPTTCFMAGANTIVGSAWPILDKAASDFMVSFYDHYFNDVSPAKAVAMTQREIAEHGKQMDGWASFLCLGAP